MKIAKQRQKAVEFVKKWQSKKEEAMHNEPGLKQEFWTTLLRDVYGVKEPEKIIEFEKPVYVEKGSPNYVDGYSERSATIIEQKAWGKDLDKKYKQSNGAMLTPFKQALNYRGLLNKYLPALYIIVSNFEEIRIHDSDDWSRPPIILKLEDLPDNLDVLNFLVKKEERIIPKIREKITVDVGTIIGELYDKISKEYIDPSNIESIESLNKLMVRLIFLFYAQSAGLLGGDNPFNQYLERSINVRQDIKNLFKVLDTPFEKRDKYAAKSDPLLYSMPYINGELFKEEIEIPAFTKEIRDLLLTKALEIDYSKIDPTIFGAIFESCLNPETRKSGGMHYTSVENIEKIIKPLFYDDLYDELQQIKQTRERRYKVGTTTISVSQKELLEKFIEKLSRIKILDPAAGSGNFLTQSYIRLRQLENDALRELYKNEPFYKDIIQELGDLIHVKLDQFYGFEIHDFAVAVAKTALWIAESQMFVETMNVLDFEEDIEFFPLTSNTHIKETNALTLDWEEAVPKEELSYIIGNPPFAGARKMKPYQRKELKAIFGNEIRTSDLDYVTCWFKKAADYIRGTNIRCALVATNSICQGAQVDPLWRPLFESGVHIDFAYQTFVWNSQALDKAHVFCVIVAFSRCDNPKPKYIYPEKGEPIKAKNINPYLFDANNAYIPDSSKPLFDAPKIFLGGQPLDHNNLILNVKQKEELIKREPQLESVIRPYMMGVDFVKNKPRYCLWLKKAQPSLLYHSKQLKERIAKVKEFRLKSTRKGTHGGAETPALFVQPVECKTDYLAIPKVSSGARNYIPMGFLSSDVIPGDKLVCMENPSLYHLGVLMSSVHMTWMQAITGRLKGDYSYSIGIVYNNFPWPEPTPKQKARIEKTAQAILDARELYPNSTLKELYTVDIMKPELLKAHKENDKAVMAAYGFPVNTKEKTIFAKLIDLYNRKLQENS